MMSKDCFEEYQRFLHQNPNLELTFAKVADILFECQKFRALANPLGKDAQYFDFEANNNKIDSMLTTRALPEKHDPDLIPPVQNTNLHCQTTCLKKIFRLKSIIKIRNQSGCKLQRKNEFLASQLAERENTISHLQDQVQELTIALKTQTVKSTTTHSGLLDRAKPYFLSGFKYVLALLIFMSIFKFILCFLMITIVEMLGGEMWLLGLKPFPIVSYPSQIPACSNAMVYLNYLNHYRQVFPSQLVCIEPGFGRGLV
ncbi:hypothetical protein PGTUg99_004294 [Puccinia graminis f. sp. tritici]|uniref:Uncharacterized protein n=1 Tax=Puccinia graminis f. sp. tritici TaxID=56615 RepID=A0A5B0S0C1_PUCGR|nr:hypothetical protein PGTUg99_004294 [Puccinia graminis f. sp. tritici]